ncbi:MAG: hypothetical protein U9P44_03340 [archaeon]|nr:hypothetical protein [archaeon]
MLEIVLVFAVFCSAVTIGVVGLGFFDKKGIYERIRKKTEDEVAGNMTVVESQGVDTAAISPLKKEMYVNIKDISDEITDTAQTMYSAIRNDYKLLKDIGLGQVETYKEFARKVGGKVIDSAASHEIGHLVSGASEVGADL